MRMIPQLVMMALLLSTLSASANTDFYDGNFESARVKAQLEGKMLLIDFYATWCAPCKWMDETTFSDSEVGRLINEKFIPIKIDIDNFDGYALKEHYDVSVLPTLLIFNEDGKVVERIEETLSPSKMTNVLNRSLASFTPRVHNTNMSPSELIESTPATKTEFKMTEVQPNYKLQLGLFSSYERTLRYYNQVSAILEEPIIIMHDYKAGNVVYRVLIGQFATTEEAHYYQTDLQSRFNIESHIYM